MEGRATMARRMGYEEQLDAIAAILQEKIRRLNSLPEDEAKAEAHKGLMEIGVVDTDGKLTPPYAVLGGENLKS